jgi:hypothetical protein
MPPSSSPSSSFTRMGRQLSQWICALHGHETELRIGANRLHLQCKHCGHQTPGWVLERPPRRAAGHRNRMSSSAAPAQTTFQTQ